MDHRAIRAYCAAEIDGCNECRPDESRDFVGKILDELEVPRNRQHYACRSLFCPHCEFKLEPGSWIMRPEEGERSDRRFIARCSILFGTRITQFEQHLARFPMLGMHHKLGKSIWRAVSRFPTTSLAQQRFVRVRRFKDAAGFERIKNQGMGAPDPAFHAISGGRYNHEGQGFLYLSSDEETAIAETFDRPGQEATGTCAVQAFEVRNLPKVLDVTRRHSSLIYSALVYERALDKEIVHSSSWKPEYLVPRFVADVARAKGFSAMLYRTSKLYYAQGLNLVIFDRRNESVVKVGDISIWERVQRGGGDSLGDSIWYDVRQTDNPASLKS